MSIRIHPITPTPHFLQTHNENQINLITEAFDSLTLSDQKKLSIKYRFISFKTIF